MMVVNSFDLWQKDVFFSAAEEVQKSTDIMESAYRLWIREKKDEICKELQAALGTAKWQLEEFEKAVRLSHKRCGDDDSSSTRHKQFVTAIENQIHRVETSLQEAYSENGKKPLRWVDLNEEERDDLAMFLSGSSRTSQSFSGESSIKSRVPRKINKMAAIRTMTNMILREFIHHPLLLHSSSKSCQSLLPCLRLTPLISPIHPNSRFVSVRCAASTSGGSGGDRKVSSRLSQVQQMLHEAEERASSAGNEPTPQITLDNVTLNFARSGGPGGQNVNKLNTKVDMRFNVKNAYWLSDRIREKILLTEKNRINKDGELVISSTKTRTQKGNIDDALEKLQAIIDAASYVPPPPSEEQKKKIVKLAAKADNKRLKSKKVLSDKKSARRSRGSYDD